MQSQTVQTFLSAELVERLNDHEASSGQDARTERQAAFLFFDISGFTRLSDRLANAGPSGVEELYRIISDIFSPISDQCIAAGGDVLFFAGDGVGTLFKPLDDGIEGATRRAAAAALNILSTIGVSNPMTGLTIRVRASLGAGLCTVTEAGGVDGRWVLVADGPAVREAQEADAVAQPGELTVSAAAFERLRGTLDGQVVKGGNVRITTRKTPAIAAPVARPDLPERLTEAAASYLSPALVHSLGTGSEAWIAEVRLVSTLFVFIPEIDGTGTELQQSLVICQEELGRVGGTVHAVLGDKGVGFLCVTGLPPHSHEDDPVRAVDAALSIRRRLEDEVQLKAALGVATGNVHCGIVGSAQRRQYEMYGVSMSLAARLMQAGKGDGLLVCPRTRAAAEARFEFGDPTPLTLKGFPEKIPASVPLRRQENRQQHTASMVGRQHIIDRIEARVEALPAGGTLVVQADAGMGKSLLVERGMATASARGARILFGAADSMEQRTPLFALRGAVAGLLGVSSRMSSEEAREAALAALNSLVPERVQLAPLLNSLLPVGFEETERTEQLSGPVRAENLSVLLTEAFRAASKSQPMMLVIEDLHWIDAGSWTVLHNLVTQVDALLLLGTTRPIEAPPPEFRQLIEGDGREFHELTALSKPETAEVIAGCLDARSVHDDLVDLVFSRSEGVPFYSQEITYALLESNALHLAEGQASLLDRDATYDLSGSVTGVITGRVDRLPAAIQLSAKVASVLGRYFTMAALLAVHPTISDAAECAAHTQELVSAALVEEDPENDRLFFRHALTHETVYGLLTHSQRKSLHLAEAERIEAEEHDDLERQYARLFEHWRTAENPEKAAHYAGLAGEQALSVWANRTAINFFEQAFELDQQARGPVEIDLKRAHWHRMCADAWYSIPDNVKAKHHYEQAYVSCGFPLPRFSWRTPLAVFLHLFYRWVPPTPTSDADYRERCIMALTAFDNLSVLYLWSGDRLSLVNLVFMSDNIAKQSGPSGPATLAHNMTGYSMMLAGQTGIAMRDMARAKAMADDVDDLHARTVTTMFLGLSKSAIGECEEALPLLEKSWDLSREMGAGLWLHRADYMTGENHMIQGRYERAIPYFKSCAEIARGAEPHTTGFANASWILCQLRLGAEPESLLGVLESPEQGVPLIRSIEDNFAMQLTIATGVLAEVYFRLGRLDEALELIRESLDIVDSGDDTFSYFRGSEAHTQTAYVLHAMWERKQRGIEGYMHLPSDAEFARMTARNLGHLKKSYKTFPAVQGRYQMFLGINHRLQNRPEKAKQELTRAVTYATEKKFPWEVVVGSVELARLTDGAERKAHLDRALETARATGYTYEIGHETVMPGIGLPA